MGVRDGTNQPARWKAEDAVSILLKIILSTYLYTFRHLPGSSHPDFTTIIISINRQHLRPNQTNNFHRSNPSLRPSNQNTHRPSNPQKFNPLQPQNPHTCSINPPPLLHFLPLPIFILPKVPLLSPAPTDSLHRRNPLAISTSSENMSKCIPLHIIHIIFHVKFDYRVISVCRLWGQGWGNERK